MTHPERWESSSTVPSSPCADGIPYVCDHESSQRDMGSHADANRMLATCATWHRSATEAPAAGEVACCERKAVSAKRR